MNGSNSNTAFEATSDKMPKGFFQYARAATNRFGLMGSFIRYYLQRQAYRQFIAEGLTAVERDNRKKLLKRFSIIEGKIETGHYPNDILAVASKILEINIPGPIVECGAFMGCSSAKLSVVAKMVNRKLYVCDSFQGLPEPESKEELAAAGFGSFPNMTWEQGEFAVSLETVSKNIRRYGEIESCEFVPGFFKDSLPNLDIEPAVIFMDVDFPSSARDVLHNLWPRLAANGWLFTHEAAFPSFISGAFNSEWWRSQLDQCPPMLFGAGTGLSILSPNLACAMKKDSV